MVKILINGASILTFSIKEKTLIDEGFIFSDEGRVVAVGEGEPPEELRYPELLIAGRERLVMPGFSTAFTSLSLYPLRYRRYVADLSAGLDYLRKLTRTDMYFLASMGLAELISRGVTSALVVDVYLDEVARAAHDLGFSTVLAPPLNCGLDEFTPDNELKLLLNRWHGKVEGVSAGVAVCYELSEKALTLAREYGLRVFVIGGEIEDHQVKGVEVIYVNPVRGSGERVIRWGDQLDRWQPGEGLGVGVRPSYSMVDVVREVVHRTSKHPLDVLYAATVRNPLLMGLTSVGPLEEGVKTNLVMLDASEPPGWPLPRSLDEVTRAVTEGNLKVETVILDDEILVDGGETLTVGSDVITKAKKRLMSILPDQ
ncbi:MAG: hypothetical protein QW705_02530 [Zestosphaera sp.]